MVPVPESGCWLWTAHIHKKTGYGRFGVLSNGPELAHRVAYELFVGPIPEGMHIDHLCRVRCCVNPKHLEPVTHAENLLRGFSRNAVNARKTHCLNGHEFNEQNTYIRKSDGYRWCKKCGNDRARRRYHEQKAVLA